MPKVRGFGREGYNFTHQVHHVETKLVTLELSRCNYEAGCLAIIMT